MKPQLFSRAALKHRLLVPLYRALGTMLQKHGSASLAAACYREAVALNPDDAESAFLSGRLLLLHGEVEAAAAAFREALRVRPDYAEAHNNLGVALYEQAQLAEATRCYEAALRLRPDFAPAHNNLGNVQLSQRQFHEAEASFRRALRIDPEYVDAHNNLGTALKEQERLEEAERSFREALRLRPDFAGALSNLGGVLLKRGNPEEAVKACREALRLQPDLGEAHASLGIVLMDVRHLAQAVSYFERQLRRNPDSPHEQHRLGVALNCQGRFEEAIRHFDAALETRPDFPEAHANRGNSFFGLGNIEKTLESYRQAIALEPISWIQSSYAFYLNYSPDHIPAEVASEYALWAKKHIPAENPAAPFDNPVDPERQLRVGYVSPDFKRHSVAYFIEPVLRNHERARIEVYCYANVASPDAYTERLKGIADHWRDISLKSDDQVCEIVRSDRIDLLVDLAGHTSGNRLMVFARKPAPVQVTYLGHPSTSGLEAIDYRITDAIADPPGKTEGYHCERLSRLPRCFLAYAPPADAPDVAPLPLLRKGYVTFGSFNNVSKINDRVIAVWAKLLFAVPNSRIVLKSLAFSSATARAQFIGWFGRHGIEPGRVEILNFETAVSDHLQLYQEIDIALDTFPYNGTTTTCEALWMGVPVIALAGDSHVSRVGVSLLTNAGLSELIARDIDEYVTLAVALANDVGRLQQFRSSLRDRLRVSTVCDAVGFTRTLENSYREMWHHWCARSRSMPPDATPPNEAKSPRRLHIGGTARSDGWEVLNANAAPYVDHVCNANDLAQFADDTFAAIYASHIVEHFDYANELASALREWNRVLVPGGKAYISVPDLDVLARLFLEKDRLTADERFFVMRMIFGGHVDRYDYHAAGLNEEFLARFLTASGYVNIKRVQQFDLFDDTSSMLFKGVAISLNMVAEKPGKSLGAQERALNSVPRTSK